MTEQEQNVQALQADFEGQLADAEDTQVEQGETLQNQSDTDEAEANGQSETVEEAELDKASEADEEDLEVVELELDEDDIVRYLEDDEGNRIGFVIMEDGEEAEYLYVEDDDEPEHDVYDVPDDGSLGITREGAQQMTDDMNAIFKDGVKMAAEFKGAFDDIKSALDFSSILK